MKRASPKALKRGFGECKDCLIILIRQALHSLYYAPHSQSKYYLIQIFSPLNDGICPNKNVQAYKKYHTNNFICYHFINLLFNPIPKCKFWRQWWVYFYRSHFRDCSPPGVSALDTYCKGIFPVAFWNINSKKNQSVFCVFFFPVRSDNLLYPKKSYPHHLKR